MDKIEFAEKKAEELMDFHLKDVQILSKEAQVTFGFIVAALSGAFGYLLKVFDPARPLSGQQWVWLAPLAVINLYLAALGAYTAVKTMLARTVMPKGNEPKNLLADSLNGWTLEQIRKQECLNLQARIEANSARNMEMGRAINTIRLAILFTPFIFLAALAAVLLVGGR